jgi:hypothetical protein
MDIPVAPSRQLGPRPQYSCAKMGGRNYLSRRKHPIIDATQVSAPLPQSVISGLAKGGGPPGRERVKESVLCDSFSDYRFVS